MIRLAFISLALPALPLPALAVTLDMPSNAALTAERESSPDSYAMPIGPWSPDGLPVQRADGTILQQAWRIDAPGITTLQLLAPLQSQLEAAGFAAQVHLRRYGLWGVRFQICDRRAARPRYVR